MMIRILVILGAFLFVAPVLADNQTYQFELNNGLKIIVRENHRAPVVLSSVWYKVGSSYEENGITGVSHALEHMMFRGSHKYGPNQFIKIVNDHGGMQNAMTTNDFTLYFQLLPADKLEIAFELESDRMRNLNLSEEDFKKEIQVVMEERRLRTEDNPQALTVERLNAAAYIHNPDRNPVIGWMSDLKQMNVSNLRNWYNSWYGPNNAILIVVGDVDPNNVKNLAEKYFGKVKSISLPEIKKYPEINELGTRHLAVKVPAQLPWLMMAYNVPSVNTSVNEWQSYALTVISTLLSNGESSRLNKNLVRGKQIAVEANTSYEASRRFDTLFEFSATPAGNHSMKELRTALFQEIKQLQDILVDEKELERTKAQIIAQYIFDKDSLMQQAFALGEPEMINHSWTDSDAFVSRIEAVTSEQIQAVAKQYFTANRLTVAMLKPKNPSQAGVNNAK